MSNQQIVTDEMIEVGIDAFCDWEENEYRLSDWVSPTAAENLVRQILESALSRQTLVICQVQEGES